MKKMEPHEVIDVDSVRLAALFVNMPEFDLNLLFDQDIPA